jgi:hypothetical protein
MNAENAIAPSQNQKCSVALGQKARDCLVRRLSDQMQTSHESQKNLKRLFFGVRVELLEATFASDPAVLIAAERDGAPVAVHAVDPDITGLKSLRRTQRVRDVSGPNRTR